MTAAQTIETQTKADSIHIVIICGKDDTRLISVKALIRQHASKQKHYYIVQTLEAARLVQKANCYCILCPLLYKHEEAAAEAYMDDLGAYKIDEHRLIETIKRTAY